MCVQIIKTKISAADYNFFLKGGAVIDREDQIDTQCPGEIIVQGGVYHQMALLVFYVHFLDTKYMIQY